MLGVFAGGLAEEVDDKEFFMLLLFLLETSWILRFHWIMKRVSPFSVFHVQSPHARKRREKNFKSCILCVVDT